MKALEGVSVSSKESNNKPASKETPNATPKKAPTPSTPTSVKGVSQSLLERVSWLYFFGWNALQLKGNNLEIS